MEMLQAATRQSNRGRPVGFENSSIDLDQCRCGRLAAAIRRCIASSWSGVQEVTGFRQISELQGSGSRSAPSIHTMDLAELAGLADALVKDGRGDLAAQIVSVLYYCAERQIDADNVIPFQAIKLGFA
jgi:hypothetical protein